MHKKIVITDIPLAAVSAKDNGKHDGGRQVRTAGLLEDDRLMEVRISPPDGKPVLGNIYVGRVQKIVKNINAAFIEIAPGLACYYPMEELKDPVYVKKIPSPRLVQGDELLVQLAKESVKTKSPAVTTNLNISGRYAVLTSENSRIGISSKFAKPVRKHFREFLKEHYHADYGVIIRTNAAQAPESEILRELDALTERMDHIIRTASSRTCFSCVYRAAPGYMAYIQNCCQEGLHEIVTDLPDVFDRIREYREEYPALQAVPLRLYEDLSFPLAKLCNLERQIAHALERRVWLRSGGYLVIEPTEALTVIDVNTGKSVWKGDPGEHFLKINLEAAREIAVQLRLRNISGIILVDFIDLDQKEAQDRILEELRRAVRADSVPVQVLDMTKLNLVEMTRKKVEKSLREQLT